MPYLSEYTMDMAAERRIDDLRYLIPITQADILPKYDFEKLSKVAPECRMADVQLERHNRALLNQSLNL